MRVLHIFVGKCRRCQNLKLRLVGIFIIINIYSDKDITIILKSTLILKTVFNIRKSLIIYSTFDTSMWKINDSGHIKNFCQITTKALCQLSGRCMSCRFRLLSNRNERMYIHPVEMKASYFPSWMESINWQTCSYCARLSINSGKMLVSRNNFISRISQTGIHLPIPCQISPQAWKDLEGMTDYDAFLMTPSLYDAISTVHRIRLTGVSVPLFHRIQEHWAICLMSLSYTDIFIRLQI